MSAQTAVIGLVIAILVTVMTWLVDEQRRIFKALGVIGSEARESRCHRLAMAMELVQLRMEASLLRKELAELRESQEATQLLRRGDLPIRQAVTQAAPQADGVAQQEPPIARPA